MVFVPSTAAKATLALNAAECNFRFFAIQLPFLDIGRTQRFYLNEWSSFWGPAHRSDGKVIPHGIYDLRKNEASLHLNGSRDTTELACESIELWWREQGQADYPEADELLIFCDGGGSNSSSAYLFKEDLQALANRLGLKIRIAHYPPYCSKYNPIEHQVFPHVTRACKGVPLETIETAKHYMEKAETTQGLKVVVRIIDKLFETGRKYAADFKENMKIQFDNFLPKWNYTAIPQAE